MQINNNPYLDQLIRDCEDLIDNIDDWKETNDILMITKIIADIKKDICLL